MPSDSPFSLVVGGLIFSYSPFSLVVVGWWPQTAEIGFQVRCTACNIWPLAVPWFHLYISSIKSTSELHICIYVYIKYLRFFHLLAISDHSSSLHFSSIFQSQSNRAIQYLRYFYLFHKCQFQVSLYRVEFKPLNHLGWVCWIFIGS